MTDFGDKASEDGFSDEIEYMDHLMREGGREFQSEYQRELNEFWENEHFDPEFLASKKIVLQKRNLENIANFNRCKIVDSFGFNLPVTDTNIEEVSRNLDFCNMEWGNVLEVVVAPKEEIVKFNKLFSNQTITDDVEDDVYFIKRTNHNNIEIWVGSPQLNSVEREFILKSSLKGIYFKAIVTVIIDKKNYKYCLLEAGHIAYYDKIPEFDEEF